MSPKTRAFVFRGSTLRLLDQRALPHRVHWFSCRSARQVHQAIRDMVVRGAPAIGCVAAYGLALAAREKRFRSLSDLLLHLDQSARLLQSARPTAVNLHWAIERMRKVWRRPPLPHPPPRGGRVREGVEAVVQTLDREARAIEAEDRAANEAMGRWGANLLFKGSVVLTYCNTGSLATAGLGTAFGVLWTAHRQGRIARVLACETRPYLQGARLTAWELQREGIPFVLITDNMAAHFMRNERVDAVVVGADRIVANGDTANKIGTYALAALAAHHKIPFYVVAPTSSLDLSISSGGAIPIEERPAEEVTQVAGCWIAPRNTPVRHPAFDVTPASLITAIITENGIARPPYSESLRCMITSKSSRFTPSLVAV